MLKRVQEFKGDLVSSDSEEREFDEYTDNDDTDNNDDNDDNDDDNDDDDDNNNKGKDSDLSDYDENNIDKEIEINKYDPNLPPPKYKSKDGNKLKIEMGRRLVKENKQKMKYKNEMMNIINKTLPHVNERPRKTKYLYHQKTLVFSSRGINQRMRHLIQDLRSLLPNSKSEPKFDNKKIITEINQIGTEKNCNNILYFEARKHVNLYLWASRVPNGPSVKFYVSNIHTMGELKLTGNCLKGARPFLIFDKKFNDSNEYKLIKELLSQIFNAPKGHNKTKPFIDHVFTFFILDNRIWFRNYQIVYDANHNENLNTTHQIIKSINKEGGSGGPVLVEIGPRFVLHPIRILRGSFQGTIIYQNPNFINPNAEKRAIKKQKQLMSAINLNNQYNNKYLNKKLHNIIKNDRQQKIISNHNPDPDRLQDVFNKGLDFNQHIVENFLEN